MTVSEIKQKLNRIFDDNLRTHTWENYVDYAIIGLIVLSTIQIFLSTYSGIEERYRTLLDIIDYVTIAAFTIEVSLRIWCADLIDDKYKGFWGRVRYCFTFYGLIDVLSTYSFYVGLFIPIPYNVLKVLRVARLLRLFRYMKAFKVLSNAVSNKRDEMIVSLQFLCIITLILSFILFFVEHAAQPSVYDNGWTSVVWAFAQYIGDPGSFAETPPITFVGRLIACIIGVLGIAIFAVPAGLIASGFDEAMDEIKHNERIDKVKKRMQLAFKLTENRNLKLYLAKLPAGEDKWYHGCKFKVIPRWKAVSSLRLKGISLDDIIDACAKYPEFRVKNEGDSNPLEEGKLERYLFQQFPVNRPYGCFIDRKSKVTIVATSVNSELGTGNFSFYLAKFAGFNYIAKYYNVDLYHSESYYNNKWLPEPKYNGVTLQQRIENGEKVDKRMRAIYEKTKKLKEQFLADLESLCQGEDSWVISILTQTQTKLNSTDVHLAHTIHDGSCDTIHDHETYGKILSALTTNMQVEFQLKVEETKRFPLLKREDGLRNLNYKLQEDGCKCNGFTMRISTDIMCFDSRSRLIQFVMAKSLKDFLAPNIPLPERDVDDMNRDGHGFAEWEQKIDDFRENILEFRDPLEFRTFHKFASDYPH